MDSPTIGRIVHYTLSEEDAKTISRHRRETDHSHGNHVQAGQVCPALIVCVWAPGPDASCNLRVWLDGTDDYWATSRHHGTEAGQWLWPTRTD